MAFTKTMTKAGQAKFMKRFNKGRLQTAARNIDRTLPELQKAIAEGNTEDIEYFGGLIINCADMIKLCI